MSTDAEFPTPSHAQRRDDCDRGRTTPDWGRGGKFVDGDLEKEEELLSVENTHI